MALLPLVALAQCLIAPALRAQSPEPKVVDGTPYFSYSEDEAGNPKISIWRIRLVPRR